MSLLWGYFTFNERLTVWYGNGAAEVNSFLSTQKGSFAPLYWTMVICNFVVPVILLGIRQLRTMSTMVISSLTVCVGMWLERYLFVVPSLGHKYLPYSWSFYRPRPNEISIREMKAGDHQPAETHLEPVHAVADRLEETTA